MSQDLQDRADVAALVTAFYERAFADPLIGPIFTEIAKMDLERHMPIMCDFWETVLFRAGKYQRNALRVHVLLNSKFQLRQDHFERWVQLWTQTIDELFAGEKAELAKTQATRIAGSIHRRLNDQSGSEFVTIKRRPKAVDA
jgi:truncated hemoglobin YjbI